MREKTFSTKRLSEEDLLYESALESRAMRRLITGLVLSFIGVVLTLAAFFPIMGKTNLPLVWVMHANEHGWTKEIEEIGLLLLSGGRIEIVPLWVSKLAIVIGILIVWLGAQIVINRHNNRLLGDSLSGGYWINAYWLKKPIQSVRLHGYQEIRKNGNNSLVKKRRLTETQTTTDGDTKE